MCASASDGDEKRNGEKREERDAALAAKEATAEKKAEEKAALAERKVDEKAEKKEEKQEKEKRPFRFLFVSLDGLIGDLAWQVKKEGHEVKYFIRDKSQKDVCDGFVQKTDDWKAEKDWADVIVFDDIGFGKDAEELRKDGKPAVGGSTYADKLEDDREFGQDELKKAGVLIAPHWDFTDFDEAIKFVKENPGRYVVKPSGKAQNEKELSFIGQEEDGNDVLNVLEHYKKTWAKKLNSFQIQKFVSGVEVAVGAFFNGKEFVTPVFINFEHKKMFPGDIGPNTGEMGCYKEGTRVLTRLGWKDFRDVSFEDEFATLNPESLDVEYQRPTAVVKYTHHKKLLRIRNNAIDLSVTLDHNMVGIEANRFRAGKRELEFVKAKDLPSQFVAFRSSSYSGERQEYFKLPGVVKFHRGGEGVIGKRSEDVIMKMDDWLAFFGLWLAEGYATKNKYSVGVTQAKPRVREQIKELLSKLPFKFKEQGHCYVCYEKSLWSYLLPLGGALEKYIPVEYLSLSRGQLEILYSHMFLGDGNRTRDTRVYYTSSKRLAENVQEMLMKIGRVGTIKERLRTGGKIGNRRFVNVHPCYEVQERVKKTVSWIDRRDMEIIDYDGAVYCVEVPNHILYVKDGEKPLWCGNTSSFFSPPNRIFRDTLEKMAPALAASGYAGYLDLNCIVNAKGIYPLEWTARFGYPTVSLQIEGAADNWGEFLLSLAKGEAKELKVKKGFQICVVVAVPPFPFDDPAAFKKYSEEATVLFKKPNYDGVHLGDVKLVEGEWLLAGNSGYAVIVTGSGQTMEDARKQAYKRVENIMIPNMFYRTDIGERWVRDSDLLHMWGYLY